MGRKHDRDTENPWTAYAEVISTFTPTDQMRAESLSQAAQAIRQLTIDADAAQVSAIADALADTELAPIVELAFQQVAANESALVSDIRDRVISPLCRRPLGDQLVASTNSGHWT